MNKNEINIRQSINTDTIDEDFKSFTDADAPLIANTGIERNGGVTNLYETKETYAESGPHVVTPDGNVIALVDSTIDGYKDVLVDGKVIGRVSEWGIESKAMVKNVDDVFLTDTGYVTLKLVGASVTLTEYDVNETQLNQRTIEFTGLDGALPYFTSISFVKYAGQAYADSQSFALRIGDQFAILQESSLAVTFSKAVQSTSVLGSGNAIQVAFQYGSTWVFAGDNGRIGSFDGAAWKNYDGSGTGSGIYSNGGAVGTAKITAGCSYSFGGINYAVFGSVTGLVGSWNGSAWVPYTSGSGIANNATVIGAGPIYTLFQHTVHLIVAGTTGRMGSWNGSAWTIYSNATAGAVCDASTIVGSDIVNASVNHVDPDGYPTAVLGGSAGKVGSFKVFPGVTWQNATVASNMNVSQPGLNGSNICYGDGVFYATGSNGYIYSSKDGLTWSPIPVSLSSGTGGGYLGSIIYANGVLMCTSSNWVHTSLNKGATWTHTSLPGYGSSSNSLAYGNGKFVLLGYGLNTFQVSSDNGATWVSKDMIFTSNWSAVTYGNGYFVAVTYGEQYSAYSMDGLTWTGGGYLPASSNWQSICYGNGLFVAVSSSTSGSVCATSPDGVTWTSKSLSASGWANIRYGNGTFMVSTTTTVMASSPDATTWTARTNTATNGGAFAYGNDRFVSMGSSSAQGPGVFSISYPSYVNKRLYTGTSSMMYPCNNAAVVGANSVVSMVDKDTNLIVASSNGYIGYMDTIGTWCPYTATFTGGFKDSFDLGGKNYGTPVNFGMSMAYGNGVYVLFKSAKPRQSSSTSGDPVNTCWVSSDGINWTVVTLPMSGLWGNAVSFVNNLFVAVDFTTGTFISSPDGQVWTIKGTNPAGTAIVSQVAYGAGLYAVEARGTDTLARILTSPDLITWSVAYTAPTRYYSTPGYSRYRLAATFAFGKFFFSSTTTDGVYWSSDGITWNVGSGTNRPVQARQFLYAGGKLVAITLDHGIVYTSDGTTWVHTDLGIGRDAAWSSVSYGNGSFIFTNDYDISGAIVTSTNLSSYVFVDRSSWQDPISSPSAAVFTDKFVGVSASLTGLATQDFTSVQVYQVPVTGIDPVAEYNYAVVAYGNGKTVAITGDSNVVSVSTDGGTTWTSNNSLTFSQPWTNMAYVNGVFVAVSINNGRYYATSVDGTSWTPRTFPAGVSFNSLDSANGKFMATMSGNLVYTSTDGIAWTQTATLTSAVSSITYANSLYVAVGSAAKIFTSPDAVTWTARTSPTANFASVAYGNGKFVALGSNSGGSYNGAYSADGISWTGLAVSTTTTQFTQVAYSSVGFTALVCGTGVNQLMASADGVTWYARPTLAYTFSLVLRFVKGSAAITTVDGITRPVYVFNAQTFATRAVIPFCDNQSLVGSSITAMALVNGSVMVAGGSTSIGSFYADGTKHQSSSGLPMSVSSSPILAGSSCKAFVQIDSSSVLLASASGAVNQFNVLNDSFGTLYVDSNGVPYSNLLAGFAVKNYLNAYMYENGQILLNVVGNANNLSYVLASATGTTLSAVNASYCWPQVSNGKTRHVCTSFQNATRSVIGASSLNAVGLLGYTDFATFSNLIAYPANGIVAGSVSQSEAGFGYVDLTYKASGDATSIYNYVSQFRNPPNELYQSYLSNADTLVNAYGKLTNNYGVVPSVPFELRVGLIGGTQSFISAAVIDSLSNDTLGTLLTAVGGIDDSYQPQVISDKAILYRDESNVYRMIRLGTSPVDPIQRVADNAYKLNTISPCNVVKLDESALGLGSIDFNNRMLFKGAAVAGTSTKVATVIQDTFSNGIDTGDKLVTIANLSSGNVEVIGYRLPSSQMAQSTYSADTYVADVYAFSTLNSGDELVVPSKVNTVYAASQYIPLPIGAKYRPHSLAIDSETTIFLKPDYDGYSIGNDLPGSFQAFSLFGQNYLFDGNKVYLASIDQVTGVYASKEFACSAVGLKLIAETPTAVYFLSDFDNSLYTFDGGRTFTKYKRMNSIDKIRSGKFSTVDNALVFDTDTSFVWVRDGVITENKKAVDQVNLTYYDTKDGLVIGNDAANWVYSYFPKTGSTVVPLALQTPYFGFNTDEKSILSNWVITIYNERKDTVNITGYAFAIDEDQEHTQIVNWTVNPVDYNDGGYARIRLQPQYQRSLGTSLRLETTGKILIVAIMPEFSEGETAVVAASRSV